MIGKGGRAALLAAALVAGCAGQSTSVVGTRVSYADFLIGRVANAREDHDIAADRYFRALQRTPGEPSLVDGALIAALGAGDLDRARRVAAMADGDAPAYAQLIRAADAINAGRWRQADNALERVEGGAAEELVGRMLAVWAQTGSGNVDRVLMDLGPLASIRPYGGLFAYQQAMALDYAGRQEEALAAYERGASGGLWLPDAVERHADLLARRGDRVAASAILGAESNQQNPALSAALARLEGGGPVSTAALTPALGASAGLYGLAAIFLGESDPSNAFATLSLSIMLHPGADGARLAFAQAHADRGRVDLARQSLSQINATSAYFASARRLEAWILLDAGLEDQAFSLAQANAESGDVRALRALADMYRNRRRFAEAEPLYSRVAESTPGDWRIYYARGAVRERLGRWDEAEADLTHALELSPNQPDIMNYLGYSWVDRGERLQEGLAMIQRAVELRPTSGAIIDSLGWAYFRLGDHARALELIERAVELEPSDPTLNDHLGDVYWRVGRRIEARFQWQRALSLTPDNPAAIELKLANGLPDEPRRQSVER